LKLRSQSATILQQPAARGKRVHQAPPMTLGNTRELGFFRFDDIQFFLSLSPATGTFLRVKGISRPFITSKLTPTASAIRRK
jgi:hypothetical protein